MPRNRRPRLVSRLDRLETRVQLTIEAADVAATLWPENADQVFQSVAAASNTAGSSIVAYSDRDSNTGKGNDVFVRSQNESTAALGSQSQVNTTSSGAQMNPDVAAFGSSSVVVWQSEGQDGSGWGVYARLYFNGAPVTGEVLVNQTTAGNQTLPKVGMAASGAFVVTWFTPDSNNGEIFARRFDSSGSANGNEFKVSGSSSFAYSAPAIAVQNSGAFAVVFVKINNDTDSNTDVLIQAYDNGGGASGSTTTVNTALPNDQAEPSIAVANSNYVVAFSDNTGGEASIFHRVYNATGAAITSATQTSQDSVGNRSRPRVAGFSNGNYVIAWTQTPNDSFFSDAVFRSFDDQNTASSNEAAIGDGQSYRTLLDVTFTAQGTFREYSVISDNAGYGVAQSTKYLNRLRLNGTSGADTIVAYDLNASTIRTTVNSASQDYRRGAYAEIAMDLGDGADAVFCGDVSMRCVINGGDGNDSILTGSGDDEVRGDNGNDTIDGGDGRDYLLGGSDDDRITGGLGNDSLQSGGGKNTLWGGEGDDRLVGSGGRETMFGEAGNDRLMGNAGNDSLDGGANGDRVYGGDGDDDVVGGGGTVTDWLHGDAGNDTLDGGKGNDELDGGDGIDRVNNREAGDVLISIESF